MASNDIERPAPNRLPFSRRRFFQATAAVASYLALIGAPGATSSVSASARFDSTAPTLSLKRQRAQDELVIAIDTDPLTFDPRLTTPTQAYPMAHHVCEPLVFRSPAGAVTPHLAESWGAIDELTWQLNLRQGVKFHNGEPFNAESVKYSLECYTTPDLFPSTTAQKRSWVRMIESIEAKDDHTVVIRTKYKSRSMLSYLSVLGMLPPKAAAELGQNFGIQAIGTGPFKLMKYSPADRAELVANADYWGTPPPSKRLVIRFIREGATRIAALEAGEVAMINNTPPDQIQRIKSNGKLDILSIPSTRVVTLYLSPDRSPWDNPKVRQAVSHAIDRDAIVKLLLNGQGSVATSVFSPSVLYYKEQTPNPYDPAKAKALLAEAGYPNGLSGGRYAYTTGRFLNDKQIGESLVDFMKDVGITVEAESPEWGIQFDNINKGVYNLYMGAYGTLTLDPDWALNYLYNSKTSTAKYNNPRVDSLLAQGDQAFDPEKAQQIYEEAQSIIWNDTAGVWLYYQPIIDGVDKRLKGYFPRADEYFLFHEASVEG